MGTSLRDVAVLAGVSVKTVSNVVNGYAHVAPATRAKVEEALARLDYRPNLSARNLRQGRTGVIALALPELDAPYFAELSRFVIDAAAEQRWLVVIEQTDGSLERERQILDGVRDHRVDGLIFSPIAIGADELAARTDDTALVLLGERIHDGPADHVAIDNVRAARDVTEHLIGLGRTRVAALGAQDSSVSGTAPLRLAGYREAMTAHGLPETVATVERYHRADGFAAMAALLAGGAGSGPTRCSASTTCSPSARCGPSSPPGSGCPRTSRWPGSTTSRTAATARRPSPPWPRTRASSRTSRWTCSNDGSTAAPTPRRNCGPATGSWSGRAPSGRVLDGTGSGAIENQSVIKPKGNLHGS
nr:hypothetical protein GCM10020093_024560 [Planobispora longispora]